jgi:hypothetical protein
MLHTSSSCSTLLHPAPHFFIQLHASSSCSTLLYPSPHYSILRHTTHITLPYS